MKGRHTEQVSELKITNESLSVLCLQTDFSREKVATSSNALRPSDDSSSLPAKLAKRSVLLYSGWPFPACLAFAAPHY